MLNPIILFVTRIAMILERILMIEAGEYSGNSGGLLKGDNWSDMGVKIT
jgi:hypothetical protein